MHLRELTVAEYEIFRSERSSVRVAGKLIPLTGHKMIRKIHPPDFVPETETVWSFPDRGDWATHVGNYRGNWSPYIPRNLILRYSKPGDTVLDQMCGGGTTLVECRLLGRHGIGVDVNPDAVMVTRDRLYFQPADMFTSIAECPIDTYVGDARNLDAIASDSVDLVATHPPYADIIAYSGRTIEGDLSSLKFDQYVEGMREVAAESLRVLKPGGHCAILIGDTRKHLHYVPISVRVLQAFLDAGFALREDIIKLQWKTKSTRERWGGKSYAFYKIAHEHLFVFRKLAEGERRSEFKLSLKWQLS